MLKLKRTYNNKTNEGVFPFLPVRNLRKISSRLFVAFGVTVSRIALPGQSLAVPCT